MVDLTRQEIAKRSLEDFKDGTIIRVGKYLIFVKQAGWGVNTASYAESDDNPMIPLKGYQMPQYINRFIFN